MNVEIDQKAAIEILDAATNKILDATLRLIQKDPHQWSTRGCATCEAITSLLNRPFGCVLFKQQQGK